MKKNTHRFSAFSLAKAAVCAALYAALTLLLAPVSYGAVQFRVSELLTVLPLFSPVFSWGLTLGCFLANLASPLGWLDLLFGTAGTLCASLLTRRLRHVTLCKTPVLSLLMPVVCNTVLVGVELGLFARPAGWMPLVISALTVGLGEAVICLGLGIPFYWLCRRTRLAGILEKES